MNRQIALNKIQSAAPEHLVHAAKRWLNDEGIEEVAERPAEMLVSDAADLWSLRQKNMISRGKELIGANELLTSLQSLNSTKKLKQFSFHGADASGSILFEKANGQFVGLIIVDARNTNHQSIKSFHLMQRSA